MSSTNLRRTHSGKVDMSGVTTDLSEDAHDEQEFEAAEVVIDAPTIQLTTRNALEGAMKHSIRLAQRSYRIAVPQFYNRRVQLLLPLFL